MIIEQPAKWLRGLYPRATWRMDKTEKAVYLTFDDGPIPESTPFILDTLAAYGAHATFFMVGDNVRKYPELFKQIVNAGHQVGNHTFTTGEASSILPRLIAQTRRKPTCLSVPTCSVRRTDGCVGNNIFGSGANIAS